MFLKVMALVFMALIRLRFPRHLSFINVIQNRYGNEVVKLVRKFEKTDFKLRKLKLDLSFLGICEGHGVVPNFLNFRTANAGLKRSTCYFKCKQRLLSEEIKLKSYNIMVLEKEVLSLKNELHRCLGFLSFHHTIHLIVTGNEKSILKHKEVHNKKLKKLIGGFEPGGDNSSHDSSQVIFNFSSYQLSDAEKSLLCKGLQFAIPPKRLDYADFMLPFELVYRDTKAFELPPLKREFLKTKLKDIAFTTYSTYDTNKVENNLPKEEKAALINLKNNKSIVIQRADKGNTVVITDKVKYIEGITSLLNDHTKFVHINTERDKWLNYVIKTENDIKKLLKHLLAKNKLTQKQYDSIVPTGSRLGILYGLPKIHKPTINNCPKFRPILSSIGTPTYKLAKFLVPILSPLTTNMFTVHNSFKFSEELSTFDSSLYMASLDIESLFTNVPLNETINNCVNDLFSTGAYSGNLSKHELFQLLNMATSESSFIFNDSLYKQVDGVAMGSPLGPTLANAFLCHHEESWLNNCPAEFKPMVYRRYVDDIFVLFRNRDHLPLFQQYMNSRHASLKFTFETEKDGVFSFLDIKISRSNNSFSTSVYRKPTFSGVFTNYKSFIFDTYKLNLVFTLLYRCFNICSDMALFHIEIEKLKSIFKRNGYPSKIIDRCIKQFLYKLYVPKLPHDTVPKKQLLIVLPFLGDLSLKLRSELRKCFYSFLPCVDLHVIFQSKSRIGNFFPFKDKTPEDMRSNVVYKFVCGSCNAAYYGKTERHIRVRSSEHLGITPLTGKRVRNIKPSAISEHLLTNTHDGFLEDFKIISSDPSSYKLLIRESLLIARDSPVLNKSVQSTPLHLF